MKYREINHGGELLPGEKLRAGIDGLYAIRYEDASGTMKRDREVQAVAEVAVEVATEEPESEEEGFSDGCGR
jgi:hypothetical protein